MIFKRTSLIPEIAACRYRAIAERIRRTTLSKNNGVIDKILKIKRGKKFGLKITNNDWNSDSLLVLLFVWLWRLTRHSENNGSINAPVMQLRALQNHIDIDTMEFLKRSYTPIPHLYALVFVQRNDVGWDWRCERCARQGLLTGYGWKAHEMHYVALSVVSSQKGCPTCGAYIPILWFSGWLLLDVHHYHTRIPVAWIGVASQKGTQDNYPAQSHHWGRRLSTVGTSDESHGATVLIVFLRMYRGDCRRRGEEDLEELDEQKEDFIKYINIRC